MIFASHPTKTSKADNGPAETNTEVSCSVEQMLHQSADWQPHCPPPADFAAFTTRALENRARNPFPPASSRPVASVQWVRGLRAPLAASLALGLVLWVGGSVNDLNDLPVSDQTRETVRPVLDEKNTAPSHILYTTEKAHPAEAVTTDTVQAPRSRIVLASRRARVRRHKSHSAGRDETMLATHDAKPAPAAPLWKTETVERPVWGALIPATFACSTPVASESGQETDETETTLMPVVLDVALPDTANLAAASSNDAPPPSTAP